MRKKIIYIILAFFALGCDIRVDTERPVSTGIPIPEPVIVHKAPTGIEPLASASVLTSDIQPTTQTSESDEYEDANEDGDNVDEDEQIKQILVDKVKAAYKKNHASIISFVVKWICILFGSVLVLYWFVRLVNVLSPSKLGFTFMWVALALISIMCVVWFL